MQTMDPGQGTMINTGAPNQGYWFVLREDQGNVIFSSSNVASAVPQQLSTPTVSESRYLVDSVTGRLYGEDGAEECRGVDGEECREDSHGLAPQDVWAGTEPRERRDQFWDRTKIRLLLTLCLENKGVEKDTDWEEISNAVGAPAEECCSKYRQLRRTYLRLLRKKRTGKDVKWVHFPTCEEVFTSLAQLPASALEPWDEARVRAMLSLYIERLPRLSSPGCLQQDVWREIAARLGGGLTGYTCYHKFKNLKRSYCNWLSRSRQTGKGMKWPYQQYFEKIFATSQPPSQRPWERAKVHRLLQAYGEIAHKFRNTKYQKKELWKDIAEKVGESPSTCDKKFRNLKQTYLRLKTKHIGRFTPKWRYFRDFESIYYDTGRYIDLDGSKILYRSDLEEDYVKTLLNFFIENKSQFRDPLIKNKTLWRMIAPKLGLTIEECDKKFRNLKQTYIRLACKKKQTGKTSKWPYFSQFEQIYSDKEIVSSNSTCLKSEDSGWDRRARREMFQRLTSAAEESNRLQRERNQILRALLQRHA